MTDASFDWPLFLRRLDIREHAWNQRRISYPRPDAVPFMPYPLPLFAALLMDAVSAAPGWAAYDSEGRPQALKFLDVGCGPGTKMQLAQHLFDLDVAGIDIVPEFVAEAQFLGLDAEVCDAFQYPYYGVHHIVLVNRPSGLQDDLENLVMSAMAPGAVLIAVNWRQNPSRRGWHGISEEYGEPVRGVWVKPSGVVHLSGPSIAGATRCCEALATALPEGDTLTTDQAEVTCLGVLGPDDGGFLAAEPATAADAAEPVGEVGVVSDDAEHVAVHPASDALDTIAKLGDQFR